MKKWFFVTVLVIVVWALVIATFFVVKGQNPTQKNLKILKKDLKVLRVVAEHRELQWKIQEYESRLKTTPVKPANNKPVIRPVPSNSKVEVKAK